MLPETAIKYITQLCNAILYHDFFPSQWKIAQIDIIMIQNDPGKPAKLAESYRSISLLPVLLKLFEKLLLSRINNNEEPWTDHQFGFRSKHATIEQIHRIVKRINNDMEAGRYCSIVFLDVPCLAGFRHQGLTPRALQNQKKIPN